MTCIVGYIEKTNSKTTIYIGADSAGISGHDITLRNDPKVFIKTNKTDSFIFGFTSSFRMGQILMSSNFNPPVQKIDDTDFNYLITDFIDEIRKSFKNGGYLKKSDDGSDDGGTFLVGYRDKIYKIENDFQVGEPLINYVSIGAGEDYALGAMSILDENNDNVEDKIYKALKTAEKFNTAVHKPFKILHITKEVTNKHIKI